MRAVLAAAVGLAALQQPYCHASCPPRAIAAASAREWSQNLAAVTGARSGQGLVVGWQPGEVWVAAPAHVIFGEDLQPAPDVIAKAAATLKVLLPGDSSPRRLCPPRWGALNPTPPSGIDLSFVCVEWAGIPLFNAGLVARDLRVGDELRLLADPRTGAEIRGRAMGVSRDDSGAVVDIQAGGLAGLHGLSGAATASPSGIAGLYLGLETSGHVLPIDSVRRQAKTARIPWQLSEHEFFDCAQTRRVCVTAQAGIAPAAITLRRLPSPSEATQIGLNDCADVAEGKYELSVSSGDPKCEPSFLLVHAGTSDLAVDLSCMPLLMGVWNGGDGQQLRCVQTGVRDAQCVGLGDLGWGILNARLSVEGDHISILGWFTDATGNTHDASGRFAWSVNSLSGQIARDHGTPTAVRLSRERN
ncbi:MAG TPA: hypothetical protein VGR62_16150 [Candidatus Binatia bacterium]|jgi:hypothetical protein|nr:hypothetical protein [Candidatus Binatia bacterium]